jgi:hypothetical protein
MPGTACFQALYSRKNRVTHQDMPVIPAILMNCATFSLYFVRRSHIPAICSARYALHFLTTADQRPSAGNRHRDFVAADITAILFAFYLYNHIFPPLDSGV